MWNDGKVCYNSPITGWLLWIHTGTDKGEGTVDVMNKVITVSREFGSGGRELGVKLADALGIPFYDKELISMAADDINIAEEAFRRYDEHIVVEDPLDRNFLSCIF